MKFPEPTVQLFGLKKKKDCGLYYQTVEMISSGYREKTAPYSLWDLSPPSEMRAPQQMQSVNHWTAREAPSSSF